ncbi:UNVERIFIED_CONTAM: hypothetical protein PYX00_002090 [Menopon gallinae]|uniref:Mitochondrial import inner membrane translocase subunit n=1 Tax=Menopon gallinae TaxID=328185 RepID=A0AAW2IHL3_9NEOP
MDSLTTESLTGPQREEIIENFQQQLAIANFQELLQNMIHKCFKKCISKPGSSLDGSEQKCLAMCMDRYLDSHNLVSKTYASRIQRESQSA